MSIEKNEAADDLIWGCAVSTFPSSCAARRRPPRHDF